MIEDRLGELITLADGARAIRKCPPAEILLERSARNYLTPFGRILNKLMHPPGLHYPFPAEGDHRLRWHYRFMSYTKKRDPAPEAAATA